MFKCYLAGYIQTNKLKECIAWRKRIREHYDNWKGKERYPITWLDPLNGLDLEICPEKAYIHRDYNSVINAHLVVANMDTFGESRIPVGTISEVAWGWEHRKPVVVISKDKQFREHPFLKYFASWIVNDVDELLQKKIINYFYKGLASAIY